MSDTHIYDVLVIGGGINGAGIARDLAGRGLSVALCEKGDLASATSSASTKLIHGGLRYLEQYNFKLVDESLREREVLLRSAPHIIWPMTFVLPHQKSLRPRWMIRAGLYLYDFLGGRKSLARSRSYFLPGTLAGQALKANFRHAFTYSDCWVDDTRLVTLVAVDAAERGAHVMTRAECVALTPFENGEGWNVQVQDHINGQSFDVPARMIVNASGPWVTHTLGLGAGLAARKIRWVKGSHIIVPRLYQGEHAFILQNDDKRIVFVIPYEKKYSLIGTTDVEYKGDLDEVRIEMDEAEYLCAAANKYLRTAVKVKDVLWTYSGVRPLVDDGENNPSQVTRDYSFEMDDTGHPPILSVYGGKLTTFRRLSEQVGDKVVEKLGRGGPAWTQSANLPGGEASFAGFDAFLKTLKREFSWLPENLAQRLARSYGGRTRDMLRGMKRVADMGEHLGDDIYAFEIEYLVRKEWAMTLEDVLWRRSKLGLHVREETQKKIQKCLKYILQQENGAA